MQDRKKSSQYQYQEYHFCDNYFLLTKRPSQEENKEGEKKMKEQNVRQRKVNYNAIVTMLILVFLSLVGLSFRPTIKRNDIIFGELATSTINHDNTNGNHTSTTKTDINDQSQSDSTSTSDNDNDDNMQQRQVQGRQQPNQLTAATDTDTTTTTTNHAQQQATTSGSDNLPKKFAQQCFPHNSKEWLSSRCLTNINDVGSIGILPPNFSQTKTNNKSDSNRDDDSDSSIPTGTTFLRKILSQSMCDESSSFVNPILDHPMFQNDNDDKRINDHDIKTTRTRRSFETLWNQIKNNRNNNVTAKELKTNKQISNDEILVYLEWKRHWTYRLIFVGIYLHQYQPSFIEMKHRQSMLFHDAEKNNNNGDDDGTIPNLDDCNEQHMKNQLLNNKDKGYHDDKDDKNSEHPSSIGINDYECKDTKYLITWSNNAGMGASFRLHLVPTLLAGIAMNRTVIIMNSIPKDKISSTLKATNPTATEFLTSRWKLAPYNCHPDMNRNENGTGRGNSNNYKNNNRDGPRNDYQCFFLPLSPCIPSEKDLAEAHFFTDTIQSTIYVQKHAKFPPKEGDLTTNTDGTGTVSERDVDAENAKVVVIRGGARLGMIQNEPRRRVAARIKALVEEYIVNDASSPSSSPPSIIPMDILEELENNLDYEPFDKQQGIQYEPGLSMLHGAALLYLLRPNTSFRKGIDSIVHQSLPNDYFSSSFLSSSSSSSSSYGMPIRASDKCKVESVCLLFDEYMDLIIQQHNKYGTLQQRKNDNDDHDDDGDHSSTSGAEAEATVRPMSNIDIILTSESSHVMKKRRRWEKRKVNLEQYNGINKKNNYNHNISRNSTTTITGKKKKNYELSFRFIVNQNDKLQGTGAPDAYKNDDAYDIMLNSIANIKLQLQSQHFVGNCCSSYHILMMDLIKTGCGSKSSNLHHLHRRHDDGNTISSLQSFHCMQELDDANFHLCCAWTRDNFCKQQKNIYHQRVKELGIEAFL